MGQNTSSAVMQQRKEPHDSLDYFPTPPWATRALCERLRVFSPLHLQKCWEPACGEGHMAKPLGEYFDSVLASDVHDYTDTYPAQGAIDDFLLDWHVPLYHENNSFDWIITNPPFRLAQQFIETALKRCHFGCAFLVRTSFLEGQGRYQSLFLDRPPNLILQFTERVSMFKGRLVAKASTATSYCWLIYLKDDCAFTRFDWIAPCRSRLERVVDYPIEVQPGAGSLFELGAA